MVVLPDYQGIGIGMKLFDFVADHACRKGNKFYVTASHPSAIHYWHRSPLWIMKRIGRANGNRRIHHAGKAASASSKRITGGFEYVGLRKENADRIKTLRESAKASK
jgi:ribosomal protein S18 acetylase RimI-like enzyme